MASQREELQAGIAAQQQGQYSQAISILDRVWQAATPGSSVHVQAQMYLIMAHQGCGQLEQALMLCQPLFKSPLPQVQEWANQVLPQLQQDQDQRAARKAVPIPGPEVTSTPVAQPHPETPVKEERGPAGMTLKRSGGGVPLNLVAGVTVCLLLSIVLLGVMGLLQITGLTDPVLGGGIALGGTVLMSTAALGLSPQLMDWTQGKLYGTHWITVSELEQLSPETSQVLQNVCADRNLTMPRLGLIEDEHPTTFTYGIRPNHARLVMSRGVLTYLEEDEVAAVYAHELGHIVHWDFAIMTVAAAFLQMIYWIYTLLDKIGRGSLWGRIVTLVPALAVYSCYLIGTYPVLYLSRTREYFADHFAAEVTGNPNALSRALVKIAYGMVKEGQPSAPSRLLEGTRTLGIFDAKAAFLSGTAYRIAADANKMGRVFLWDLFNPWAMWMELQSTHPLMGKRVRALGAYAEQLELDIAFDMGRVVAEGRRLNKKRLYGHFWMDLIFYWADWLGLGAGCLLGTTWGAGLTTISCMLIGLGVGLWVKTLLMYPNFSRAPQRDMLTLMSDPYVSPLRGQPVQLQGQLTGRDEVDAPCGATLVMDDKTGWLFLRASSRLGLLGNVWFRLAQVTPLIGTQAGIVGWFRRGVDPWMDLIKLKTEGGQVVKSYHRFWSFLWGGCLILLGIIFDVMLIPAWFTSLPGVFLGVH
ncbi:M48 family metalloprotease [Acaryochloris sp. IP29b_bin.148]|uniref:M48 family metalloprotease n=1 Tax=Acaryochloris sp. IP29b_bin.148 TaxID=2969218 RepID=UPI002631B504|nr:M48 family metalloprotease [Acaryochloris sp. IP29b_bin.148]